MNLFDLIPDPEPSYKGSGVRSDWKAPEPPSLRGIDDIELDLETTGLRWWAGDKPVGIGVGHGGSDGKYVTRYLAFGHPGGGNLPEEQVKEWSRRELQGKRITNLNIRFDIHMFREWGVDLEKQGNIVSDVGHYAALIDDHRKRFNQKDIVRDYLPDEAKVERVGDFELDGAHMAKYPAGIVAQRAEGDVRQVYKLKKLMWPIMDAQGLHKVRKLEEKVIYPVCEMEKNGTRINVEKLHLWLKEIEIELNSLFMQVYKETSLRVNPDKNGEMVRLFEYLKLPISYTAKENPSFTGAILRKFSNHPTVAKVIRMSKLIDLKSRLDTYRKTVDSNGIIRYALHQLKTQKDEHATYSQGAGTVTGRFSSTKILSKPHEEGINIQQVLKVSRQIELYGDERIIRELHIPDDGMEFLSADAMQIEYRLFAGETKSDRLIRIFDEDPMANFHQKVLELLREFKKDLTYKRCKDLNFAKIYGAGLRKMALMLGFVTEEQYRELLDMKKWYKSPLLNETKIVNEVYNREIPEAEPLIRGAQELAEIRGFIKTIVGRRSRFINGNRSHKGLNSRIQGSAADIAKQKLVELHEYRHETGFKMRYPIHDEVDGDIPDREHANKVNRILNQQSFNLRVPILWEVSTGPDWYHQTNHPTIYLDKEWIKAA